MNATQLYRKHNGENTCCQTVIVRSVSSAARQDIAGIGDAYKLLTKCGFLMRKCSLCSHQWTLRTIDCTLQRLRSLPYQVSISSKVASTSAKVWWHQWQYPRHWKTGKTEVHFIDKGTKVDGRYCRETLLQNCLLSDIGQLCDREFVFQHDGAPSHQAKLTVEFLQQNVPNFIEPSDWPPNSPDINPVDYAVWVAVQQDVCRVPIVGLVWSISKTECVPAGPVSSNNWSTSHWPVATEIENCS